MPPHLTPFLASASPNLPAQTVQTNGIGLRPESAVTVSIHRHADRVFVEIEPPPRSYDASATAKSAKTEIDDATKAEGRPGVGTALHHLIDDTVQAVADVTEYDRVMLYLFHPDWSGEVVAEARQPDMVPFLGLRYPATDIPSQARQLYTVNLLRVIADVAASPVPIIGSETTGEPDEPPDLTMSVLRSVSPYHIEYLRNMGVAATLTASVIVDGDLWGLIACHHRTPHRVSPDQRSAVARLAQDLAEQIATRQRRLADRQWSRSAQYLNTLKTRLAENEDLASALLTGAMRVQDVLEADGAVITVGETMAMVGQCPTVAEARTVLAAAVDSDASVYVTDHLAAVTGSADAAVAGLAVTILSRDPLFAIGVFRAPIVQDVFWAGDPSKPATRQSGQERVSPRQSFAAWKETHRDHSQPWAPWSIDLLDGIGRAAKAYLGTVNAQALIDAALATLEERSNVTMAAPGGFVDEGQHGFVMTVRDEAGHVSVSGVNRVFRELFYGVDEIDESWQAVGEHLGVPGDLMDRAFPGPVTCESWSRTRGRRVLEISGRSVLTVADQAGVRTWDVLTFVDVTAASRSAAALASARDQAERTSRLKSEFLANVGHDLKTPLNAIIGYSDLILSGVAGSVPDQISGYLEAIHGAGRHQLAMINELLDLSRFETGRQALKKEVLDLGSLCANCRDWISVQPGADAQTWQWDLPAEPLPVRGDETILRRAILNLLTNALKFTPAGGSISLSIVPRRDGTVAIEVADTGIGIPEQDIHVVFLPFRRGSSAEVEAREGFGMGLAMVKAVTEAHGGWVEVTSTLGAGSTFRMVLNTA